MLKKSTKFILAILAAVALILIFIISLMALAFWRGGFDNGNNTINSQPSIVLAPVTNRDHLRGSLSAPIMIVEFADLECPACKEFHPVMKRIFNEYQGKVAWIFRHYPVDSLHLKARKEAEAAECANELGGNEKFWQYVDFIFQVTPSNDGLGPEQLPEIAAAIGLDRNKFSVCLTSGKYAAKIDNDLQQALIAIASGRQGTPYSVIIIGGEKIPISGAAKYEQMKTAVDALLAELEKRK